MAATAQNGAEGASPEPGEEPVIGGVRALLYVAVQSALSEGFSEEEVFEHEKLSPEAWQRADEAWAAALADSAEKDSKLFDNYDATFNAYKWAFHRVIEPLENDLDAWMNFTGKLNKSEDQKQFLGDLGMDQNDVIRLQQIWAARVAEDAPLRERMAERMGKEPGEVPPLDVPPKRLPAPVNDAPIVVPPSPDDEPEAAPQKPPPPPLLVALPAFPKAPAPAAAANSSAAAPNSSAPPRSAPPTALEPPPREEFGFYVPPPDRVGPRSIPAPAVVQPPPVAAVTPPAFVSAANPPPASEWQRTPAPQLGMHEFTAALAEMLAFPGMEARVAAKYGMTPDGFAKERVAWDNHLVQVPSLKAEYTDRLSRQISHWQALARRR